MSPAKPHTELLTEIEKNTAKTAEAVTEVSGAVNSESAAAASGLLTTAAATAATLLEKAKTAEDMLSAEARGRRSADLKQPTTIVTQAGNTVASPTSTEEQDRMSAGQRAINLIWETTQMKIALSVIWCALLVAIALAMFGKWLGSPDIQLAAVVFLFGVANLVTGFYFGRTNHTKVGGVGTQPTR